MQMPIRGYARADPGGSRVCAPFIRGFELLSHDVLFWLSCIVNRSSSQFLLHHGQPGEETLDVHEAELCEKVL